MSNIHILTNITVAINAIDDGTVDPFVDVGNEYVYLLDTSAKAFGSLIYTEFNKLTGAGTRSFRTKYSTAHTVQQVMFGMGMSRSITPPILDRLPDYDGGAEPDSSIIPGCYCK